MTRHELIIELARTLRDVQGTDTVETGHGGGKPDSRVLQHTSLYHAGSYTHLEHALDRMRLEGDPVRQWRWHFTTRYLASERKPLPARTKGNHLQVLVDGQWQPAKPRDGHREPLGGMYTLPGAGHRVVMVETWHNHVQPPLVTQAVRWLDKHLPARLWLPDWSKAA